MRPLAVVCAAFAVAALAAHVVHAAGAAPPPGIAVQLTHTVNDSPAPAPDGQRWIYLSVVAGWDQLFIMRPDGSHPVQVTHGDFDHDDPSWSPDGKKIAFVSGAGGGAAIAIMNPDGSDIETLTPPTVRAIHPSWAPDSRSLVYCTDDDLRPPRKNDSDIIRIDLATRRSIRLVTGGTNTYPVWSPDGAHLVFRRMVGPLDSEVFVADRDGSHARNLTNHPAFDGWPAWSPDGREIAFASNRHFNYQIYVMKADGSDVRLVANTEGRATAPKWSTDGTKIYFPICKAVDFGRDCEIFVAPAPR